MDLVVEIYTLTKSFPKEELYGLVSQMRRAAVSYPSNISEGAARKSANEYVQFLYVALGSLAELETQLMIAEKIGYANTQPQLAQIELLRKKHLNFIKYLKSKPTL